MNPRPTKVARMTRHSQISSPGRSQSCSDDESDAYSAAPMCPRSTSGPLPIPTPLPRLGSPDRAQSCPEPVASAAAPETSGTFALVPNSNDRPRGPNETQLDTMQEIRVLRTMVTSMEEELRVLQSKWTSQLPDKRTLVSAQRCAVEKHAANQAESIHRELQQLFRQQQILFATMQTAALRLPLESSSREMFEELHFDPQLGRDPTDRKRMLLLHLERSLASVPSIVMKFSQLAIDKAKTANSGADQSVMPLSQIDIAGCKDCTLISSVFVSEIQHTSLEEVYDGVLAYFNAIPTVIKRHLGIDAQRRGLDSAGVGVNYRRSTFKAEHSWTVNNIFCSELTRSHGMIHIDVVTDDPLHPIPASASSHYCVCGVIVTPRKDPVTGKNVSVMLRRLVVYRYNMLPHEPAVLEDVQIIRPLLNGELINAWVCSYIQQLRQQQGEEKQ
ncbi:hypothetical protein PF005_g12230 [Phytophthora fragariae]|uniref:Uncharacterized protein n=1 Tax=Phytophthora fragariae TaxID=53985 RepID=A0A6A3Z3S5_9STRA|nr:hypothetical protein PF003_g23722 [Phytophthora fragariae]KAE8936708.1 hypothetical protein PF009_g13371 [Phytophthora fragariae]KAE9007309.1 hypothetical protein PF011_g11181 [Phytophthora fragariae]KAE9108942.1 hypothetical protein PF010_g11724 [Phytophthora fragariae]KAE9108984.1 hypothetical protein PF007_g12437 [Phytophthora fragariae]